jgi:methyl-accepting chemotaxis protein
MTIGKRVILGFVALLLVSGLLGGFAAFKLQGIKSSLVSIANDSVPSMDVAGTIESGARDGLGQMLEHIIADDQAEMAAVEAKMKETGQSTDSLIQKYETDYLTSDTDRGIIQELKVARDAYRASRQRVLELSRAQKPKEAFALAKSEARPLFDKYINISEKLQDFNAAYAQQSSHAALSNSSTALNGMIIGNLIAIAIGTVTAILIIRSVTRALTRLSETLGAGSAQVASASTQVSGSSQSLAQGASEQAAALEETTSALEEMSSMTRKNSETAQQAASLSEQAKQAADKSNTAMTRMNAAINEIQKSASETAKIIKVIDEIAFQTNLLALNAAVEAARAGEAGKGFAVVAEEVRNLAMRSAEAAKNTAAMIEESVNNSRNGVSISAEVAKTLEEITDASAKMNGLVNEISAASKEQAQGIQQVNTAVGQMDKVTQATAANAEESAAAAEELNSQAEQMAGVVRELMILVRGQRDTGGSTSQTHQVKTSAHAGDSAGGSTKQKKLAAKQQIPLDAHETKQDHSFAEFSKAA